MFKITKKIKNVLIVLLVITMGIIFVLDLPSNRKKNVTSKNLNLSIPTTIIVENETDYKLEISTKIILNKIFCYDTILISYRYMLNDYYIDNNLVLGHIIKNDFFDHQYIIFLSKNLKQHEIDHVISHELIHLDQYESNKLIKIDETYSIYSYEGKIINLNNVSYSYRQFEIDAYLNEDIVYNQLFEYRYIDKYKDLY